MIGHLWPKLDMERYSNVSGHMLPDPCSRNYMNPLSPDTGRTVTSQTDLNSVKSYNHNSPNIWVEILVDSIFSWFGSKSNFFARIQMAPAPRILYLGRKGLDVSTPKNIARKLPRKSKLWKLQYNPNDEGFTPKY